MMEEKYLEGKKIRYYHVFENFILDNQYKNKNIIKKIIYFNMFFYTIQNVFLNLPLMIF